MIACHLNAYGIKNGQSWITQLKSNTLATACEINQKSRVWQKVTAVASKIEDIIEMFREKYFTTIYGLLAGIDRVSFSVKTRYEFKNENVNSEVTTHWSNGVDCGSGLS